MAERRRIFSFWGPLSGIGMSFAALAFAIDQLYKYWMIHIYQIAERGKVEITPFFDLVMVWNRGVSYGLLAQDSALGRYALAGFAITVSLGLVWWLARQTHTIAAVGLGLVIGGALGNALDRLNYGAVADFFSLHAFGYHWYVFNIADVAIVIGVIALLYEALFLPEPHHNTAD